MLVDLDKLQKAKEKLGDKMATIIAQELDAEGFDERNLKMCCPWHNEDHASCVWSHKELKYHCFGRCGRNYDILDAFMKKGMSYIGAVQKLFELAGMDYAFGEVGVKTKREYRYPHEEPLNDKAHVYEYLGRRGISKETIDAADVREDAHGNIVFNYRDTNDVLCMVKYRPSHKIDKAAGEIKCWCQKDADTTPLLFNMNRVNVTQPLLVVEGEVDSLAAIEAGWTNTVSVPLGAGNFGWIEENFDWLEQFPQIIICSDNDEAGIKMRKECVYRLGSWRTKYVEIPKFYRDEKTGRDIPVKDLNEVLYYAGRDEVMRLINNPEDPGVPSVVDASEIADVDIDSMDGVTTGIKKIDAELMRLFYGTLTIVSGLPGCVDCETEFFNGERWKKISEYTPGDMVLQYNADKTASLVYPEQYHKYECDTFYHLHTTYGIEQMISDNHNVVYVTREGNICKKSMSEVYSQHQRSKNGFAGKFIGTFDYCGSGISLSDDEIRLMCAVIADGTFDYSLSPKAKTYGRCRINLKKDRKKDRLKYLLDKCHVPYEEHQWNKQDPQYRNYTFYPPIYTKLFPAEWYNMSKHQMEVFVDEVLRWDGSVDRSGRKTFSTTVSGNADFVQFIFTALGYRSAVSCANRSGYKSGTTYTRRGTEYTVTISQSQNVLMSYHHHGGKNPIDICKTGDGYKYCFTVPSGMLVLRRNGRINITGNSGKTSFLSQVACQSLEQDKNVLMFSRELPGWMQRSWLNFIMSGPHNVKRYEDQNGALYWKVPQDVKSAIGSTYGKKWFLYRDDAPNTVPTIMSAAEDCVRKYGVKLIILDNLMTIDLGSTERDELQKQTEFINTLVQFAVKYSVAVILVAHPRKMPPGMSVGLHDVAGTSNIINLCHRTIALKRLEKRDAESDEFDVQATIVKDRLRGRAGSKIGMYYDPASRRFYTNEAEYNYQYKWESDVYHDPIPYPHAAVEEVIGGEFHR